MISRIWHGWTSRQHADAYEAAVVPPKARVLLSRFDACSAHYHVLVAAEQ